MEAMASDFIQDNCYPHNMFDHYVDDQAFEPYIVVGIDFGTAGTAFAIQLRTDYENNKHEIYYDKYLSRNGRKNSTSLLIRKDNLMPYFGVEAEEKYRRLKDPDDWHFFRHFKMQIYRGRTQQDIDNETLLTAEGGEKVPAVTVFAASLICIKREVDEHLIDAYGSCLEKQKKWVITVPAIWSDGAKTLMRSAAEKAGIESKYLSIALEPEAGAIYYAVTGANPPNDPNRKNDFPVHIGPGSTFMVVDIGAGTVDITTMTIMKNGNIKQIHESDGGPAGGENVDRKFIALVAKLLGEKTWRKFAKESSRKYAQFRESVEAAKKDLKPTKPDGEIDDVLLDIPEEILRDFAREQKETDLASAIRKAGEERMIGCVGIEDGQLCFKADILRRLMDKSVEEILTFIKDVIISETNLRKNIHAVVLVGGFALSDFLYKSIQREIKSVTILRPWSCDKAVLRGAVLFGHNERILSVRIPRLTYGIKSFKPFKSIYPLERKVIIDGKAYVKDYFSKHVTRGQEVHIDEWTTPREYKPQCNSENTSIFIYSSNADSPTYIDEDSCKSIGQLVLDFTRKKGKLNLLEVSFNFGHTELLAKVTHQSSGVSAVGSMRFQSI
ncbi:heat shock 70 kDa protein 12A-like [Mercenaria mercenaria]|uniref:heat shock 70 kDa protein 12A-like n=1 Tax=Mercenaria mercenaria TaxID=6596 RepID=UPI001E1DC83E|nr:heat shock 70 kDa protein 12A-like [Mercenaria mercenaria]